MKYYDYKAPIKYSYSDESDKVSREYSTEPQPYVNDSGAIMLRLKLWNREKFNREDHKMAKFLIDGYYTCNNNLAYQVKKLYMFHYKEQGE